MTRVATLARGLAAMIVLAALLVGVPWALAALGGNPLAAGLPSLDDVTTALTRPDDGTLLRLVLIGAGWIGWATFALSVLLEIPAQLRGVHAPRLPAIAAPQQRFARALVSAILSLSTIAAPAAAHAAPHSQAPQRPATTASQQATPHAPLQEAPAAPRAGPDTVHVVQRGETLWEISKGAYGKGSQYQRLVDASKDTVQPDGAHLTNPDRVQTGWRITVPAATTVTPTKPAPKTPAPAPTKAQATTPHAPTTAPAPTRATAATPQPSAPTRPVDEIPGALSAQARATARHTPAAAAPTATDHAPTAAPFDLASDTRTRYGLGALAAAGLLALLAAKRTRGGRHRQPGRRVALPAGPDAVVEAQTRTAADPLAADVLSRALRTLAAHHHQRHQPMPALRAARLATDSLEIYLTDTAARLPAPFVSAGDGVWLLARGSMDDLLTSDELDAIPAPFPALVTLGLDEEGASLLINLEEAGTLAITGPHDASTAVLTALAVELIGSPWADDAVVELVDCLPELADAMDCDRVVHSTDLDHVLTGLEHVAGAHAGMLTRHDVDGSLQARTAQVHPETWTPHLLIVDRDLTDAQRDRIAALVEVHPRLAIAAVTTGSEPVGEWQLDLDTASSEPVAVLEPTGLVIAPQMMPADAYDSLISAFTAADEIDAPGPEWATEVTPAVTLDQIPVVSATHPSTDPATVPHVPVDDTPVDEPTGWWTALDRPDGQDHDEPGPTREDAYLTSGWSLHRDPTTGQDATVQEGADEDAQQPQGSTRYDAGWDVLADKLADVVEDHLVQTATEGAAADAVSDTDAAISAASDPVGVPSTQIAPTRRLMDLAPARDLLAGPGPLVRLLGSVEIQDATGKRPRSPGVATEIVAYLALHPGRGHQAFDAAIWPGKRLTANTRNAELSHTRNWLGTADDGHPYIAIVEDDVYKTASDLRCDWTAFQEYIGASLATADDADLVAALKLVDGQPLTPPSRRRMDWADRDKTAILAAVADVAHELATRALRLRDHVTATWAAQTGLEAEPVAEFLWRDLLLAIHASGDRERLAETVARLHITMEAIDGELDDDTAHLIDQLTDTYALTPA